MSLPIDFSGKKFYGQFTERFNPSIITNEFIDENFFVKLFIGKLIVNVLTDLICQ